MEIQCELLLENLELSKETQSFVKLIHKMIKYNNLIQKFLDSQLNELKSTTKNASGMTLRLSSKFTNETEIRSSTRTIKLKISL